VALNRPAYQVSVYGTHLANNANDGNRDTHLSHGTCMHTLMETNPWWAVDLLVPLYVAGVNFTNRQGSGMSEREFYTNKRQDCSSFKEIESVASFQPITVDLTFSTLLPL